MSTTSTPKFLHIRLEGSFCVVIQKNSSYKIRAGTPMDPDHLLAINGQQIPYKSGDSFHFELMPDGLETYNSWPEIDPAFDWSNKTTNNWDNNYSYYFIAMDLPCPKQIMQDCTTRVIFDDFSSGLMPHNHILIYEIKDFSKLRIASDTPNPAKIDQNGVLSLEIGLPRESSPSKVHDHTINCHNNMLKKFFPDLHKDKRCRLKDIEVSGSLLDTTTLECKSGGMIVGYQS